MTKYDQLITLIPFVSLGFDPSRLGDFFDAINHSGPGDTLRGIVDAYPQPVGQMATAAAKWFYDGAPKPEWLVHAGY